MSFWTKLAGTMLSVFKIGGPGGPQIKNTAGVLAARNTSDSAYAQFEADLRHLGQAPQTINDLTELNPADPAADFIPVWDTSAGATRKTKPNNLGLAGGGAPSDAVYIVQSASAGLSAERVLTDTTELEWDFTVGGVVTGALITNGVVLSRLEVIPAHSVVSNYLDSPNDPSALAATADNQVLQRSTVGGGTELRWEQTPTNLSEAIRCGAY